MVLLAPLALLGAHGVARLRRGGVASSANPASLTSMALASGFGSVRRFNETFQALYGRPPSALRRRGERVPVLMLTSRALILVRRI